MIDDDARRLAAACDHSQFTSLHLLGALLSSGSSVGRMLEELATDVRAGVRAALLGGSARRWRTHRETIGAAVGLSKV